MKRKKFGAAFRDNYLAAALLMIALVFSGQLSAQVDTNKVRQNINAYGYSYKNIGIDSSLRIPRDTFKLRQADSGSIAFKNGRYWNWTGQYWDTLRAAIGGGAAGGADGNNYPTSLSYSGSTLTLGRNGLANLTTTINVPAQFNPTASGGLSITGTYPNMTFSAPAQFNPIAGTNVTLSGTYPNITFNATGGGGGSSAIQTVLGIGNRKSITIVDTNSLNQHVSWYGEPNNYGTSYGIRGNAGKFGGFGWSRHDVNASGRPNVVGMAFSYNATPDGGRIDVGEASLRWAAESHYEMNGGKNYFEIHYPEFIDKGGIGHRPWSAYIEKEGTGWSWSSEGSGIGFSKWGDQNTQWGYFSPGDITSYQYVKNQLVYPRLRIGAIADSVNMMPWATKYNFEITNENQYVYIGRRSAIAADNAQINVVDYMLIGGAGIANRRGLGVYGPTSLVDGETYIDNAAGGPRSLSVWYNGARRLEIGSSIIQFYSAPIYHDKSIFSLEAFKAGGGSYIPSANHILELESTTKSTLFPKLTTTTRDGLAAQSGMFHFNTTNNVFEGHDGTSWKNFATQDWVTSKNYTVTGTTQTITSGTATTVSAGVGRVVVNPGSVLASHTLTLPASPTDRMVIDIYFGGTIAGGASVVTSLTISANTGQTLMQPTTPSTAIGGDWISYEYNSANAVWYRRK